VKSVQNLSHVIDHLLARGAGAFDLYTLTLTLEIKCVVPIFLLFCCEILLKQLFASGSVNIVE